jgi:hypothetical protein
MLVTWENKREFFLSNINSHFFCLIQQKKENENKIFI